MTDAKPSSKYPKPTVRILRAFAFDPSLNTSIETAVINHINIQVPWELLHPGPVGEYLEVVDIDPASQLCYPPIDLNDPHLIAQNGLAPSEGTPQFHQQMVYAVATTTVQNFEQALGRRVLWAVPRYAVAGEDRYQYLPRLRIYPHALREANAYYSPVKKAVLFGYFPASDDDPGNSLPGGMVFTCLSHDIVAHEITHALLESLHPRYIEPSNVDVLALHEAFADIVALFQHFSYPDVLRQQIARTRGDLASENLLAELAQQFGHAIGSRGALRSALGEVDKETGKWRRKAPDPSRLRKTTEPHARGAILLAAVFDAFLTIYRSRTEDLFRIATGGSGVLSPGEIHPDLVGRLAEEAAKSSAHILRMCIRAMDYVPPVDVNFGDYLRALITADADLIPNDRLGYRLAIVEAFRRHGIYPLDVRSLSEESLLWDGPTAEDEEIIKKVLPDGTELRSLVPDWGLESERGELFKQSVANGKTMHGWLKKIRTMNFLGLALSPDSPRSIYRKDGMPTLEVHSVRPTYRVGPTGRTLTDLVVEITQRRRGYYNPDKQHKVDTGDLDPPPDQDFIFRGGVSLLINLETGKVRYAICKRVASKHRLEAQRRFLTRVHNPSLRFTYFGDNRQNFYTDTGKDLPVEPFALLHRYEAIEEDER